MSSPQNVCTLLWMDKSSAIPKAGGRLDGEWEEEWLELVVDEGDEAHGLLLGGGFNCLGSDGNGGRSHGSGIDEEVLHEGGVITGVMIVLLDR